MMQLDFFRQEEEQPEQKEVHELHCRKCNQMKPLSSFSDCAVRYETEPRPNFSAAVSGTARWCSSCKSEYSRGKLIATKLAGRRPTEPTPCECCGTITAPDKLHLDHDHVTHAFRGWLCRTCNLGIGSLGDNVDGLQRAIAYLRKTNERT
jgi:hypothetical protein